MAGGLTVPTCDVQVSWGAVVGVELWVMVYDISGGAGFDSLLGSGGAGVRAATFTTLLNALETIS